MSAAAVGDFPESNPGPPRALTDDDFVRLALEWRLLEPEELARSMAERADRCPNTPALDFLVWLGLITPAQSARVESALRGGRGRLDIPGYELLERIGAGGMGEVYKARQLRMDRVVAVKVLKARLSRDAAYIGRFLREARLAAKLAHNNIVQAIDAGQARDCHYLVMELVEGRTVRQLVRERGRLDEPEAVRVALQIAHALDHASKRDMIHRDIKPENILLTADGVAKLADMGLARVSADAEAAASEHGVFVGTVYYVAPEQIRGAADIDIRADLYALGATLFMMLAGHPPFEGDTARGVLLQHLEKRPPRLSTLRPELSEGVAAVVETLLAKDRRDRYPTPAELIADLEALLAGRTPQAARERLSPRLLQDLGQGEALDDQRRPAAFAGSAAELPAPAGGLKWLAWTLAGLLLASLAANFALAVSR